MNKIANGAMDLMKRSILMIKKKALVLDWIRKLARWACNFINIAETLNSLSKNLEVLKFSVERLEDTINTISSSRNFNQPVRVVFLVHHATSWLATKPVLEHLTNDIRFEVIAISLPHIKLMAASHELCGEEEIHKMLVSQNIKHIRISEGEISHALRVVKAIKPDVIFRQTPWPHDLPSSLDAESLSFTRICYIPYGYMTAAIEDKQFNQDFHQRCWKIFCPDEAHLKLAEKYCLINGINCVVTGYPKFDYLTDKSTKKWPINYANERSNNFKLIWAPHWSFMDNWLKFGAFSQTSATIFNLAKAKTNLQIVLRPHPVFLEYMDDAETGSEIEQFINEWNLLPNTFISREADYAPLFAASDALLTDGLSFLSEYQLFDKPLIFFEREDTIGFNSAGKNLLSGLYRLQKPEQIEPLLNKLMQGEEDDSIVDARCRVAKTIHPYPQQAASRIAEIISSEISYSMQSASYQRV
ncbi:CDP-glycerol glycerophosphotransferase family protein [Methylicorpusculum oleiharenae]|uniref:CDP-glycerol glycerophosphotransferase family protein n=1 Tax=Methylicorpusculum oleiharenae TaxID=1338687 RepID=UPI00135CA9C4|nr:CDP-glycerol glycerophosphotransferase family protein [Methylicorpusculum oleiharenae]MCD2452746.1 CDP-glycerol glycerophosphotransferase family protein [Methylicorpusculum oleiharenae]